MDGFEKSAKTTRTPPQVPFQTRTRAQTAAEVVAAAAEYATAKTVAVNTTDTNTITATENLSPHPHVTDAHVLQPTLLREILLELNEARTEMDIYRQRLGKLETDREAEHQRRQPPEA